MCFLTNRLFACNLECSKHVPSFFYQHRTDSFLTIVFWNWLGRIDPMWLSWNSPIVWLRRVKGIHGFWNFEKSIFFIIFYIIVQHVKNIFAKFQVNRSKVLRERFLKSPPFRLVSLSFSNPYGLPFVSNAFFAKLYFQVGGHDFSKTNAPISLKFCKLLLDKINSRLNEGFFFLRLQLSLQANTWPNFYWKSYCFVAYNSAKNSNFNFLKILCSITSYTHLLIENIWFFDSR